MQRIAKQNKKQTEKAKEANRKERKTNKERKRKRTKEDTRLQKEAMYTNAPSQPRVFK